MKVKVEATDPVLSQICSFLLQNHLSGAVATDLFTRAFPGGTQQPCPHPLAAAGLICSEFGSQQNTGGLPRLHTKHKQGDWC